MRTNTGEMSTPPMSGITRRTGLRNGSANALKKGATGWYGFTQERIGLDDDRGHEDVDRKAQQLHERHEEQHREHGRVVGDVADLEGHQQDNCSTYSKAHATMSDDQSSLNRPGTTRLSGFTAQSVSAMEKYAIGLREGARKTCIQKRTSAVRMKRLASVFSTNRHDLARSLRILSERRAQLARSLTCRFHRVDEARVSPAPLPALRARAPWCRPWT